MGAFYYFLNECVRSDDVLWCGRLWRVTRSGHGQERVGVGGTGHGTGRVSVYSHQEDRHGEMERVASLHHSTSRHPSQSPQSVINNLNVPLVWISQLHLFVTLVLSLTVDSVPVDDIWLVRDWSSLCPGVINTPGLPLSQCPPHPPCPQCYYK